VWAQHDKQDKVSILLGQVNNKDRSISNAAANALEQVDEGAITESFPALSKAARDKDNFVRQISVWLLGRVSRDAAPKAIVELKQAIKDRDAFVRASAVHSLGRLGRMLPHESTQALTSALRDENLYVRSSTADALGEIGPTAVEAIGALIAAGQDPEWLVRVTALKALAKIGRGTAGKEIIPVLRTALNEENPLVRVASIEALGEIGVQAENTVADLTKSLQDSRKFVRAAAMNALGRIAREGITEAKLSIESALQSPIEETRSLAANVFWRMGLPVKKCRAATVASIERRVGRDASRGSASPRYTETCKLRRY
jgi:HEAT repeat protein